MTAPAIATTGIPPTPSDRFARIVQGLHDLVASQGLARGLAGPFILLICARLRRLVTSFAAYADCAPPRPRKPEPLRQRRISAPPLPRRFAWLLRCVPGTAAAASQLRHLLAEPDMRALIETRPATGRALRPLCHLLGIRPPPTLRLPRKPRPAAPKAALRPAPPDKPGTAPAADPPEQEPAWPKPPPRYATDFSLRRPRPASGT